MSHHQERDAFELSLLHLLLSKIPGEHSVKHIGSGLTQARIIRELSKPDGLIDLYWMGSSNALEQELRAVYFPIYRGLVGYRTFIVNNNQKGAFANIKSLAGLRQLVGMQGIGWSDTEVLQSAGLQQLTAPYENIFEMIHKGRAHYFSRSVLEVRSELATHAPEHLNIDMDASLLLVYPFAMYYFTGPQNTELAQLLEQAFAQAYADGSYLGFFYQHPKTAAALDILKANNRKLLEIDNPFFSPRSKAIEKQYWH